MLMKLKYWRGKNDGLNSLAYSMRFVEKKPLYTHLMIESRLLVPQTIKMVTEEKELINIGKLEMGWICLCTVGSWHLPFKQVLIIFYVMRSVLSISVP